MEDRGNRTGTLCKRFYSRNVRAKVIPARIIRLGKVRMLSALTARLGREQAILELKWLKQAAEKSNVPLADLVRRRTRDEPLQYILGLFFPTLAARFGSNLKIYQVHNHSGRSIFLRVLQF